MEIISPPFVLLTESEGEILLCMNWVEQTASVFLFVIFLVFRKSFSQRCFQRYPPDIIYKVNRGALLSFYLPVFHFVVKPLLSFTLT